ncbi:protein huluwa [Thalassophryne amazonica]|uniref:protein huluwa n=1 Tax=Thalassophryne amazonica TaxID=390379 RepID=UPI001471ACFC|nr:protein huluwa [Thalassophryne amazonica]
MSQEGQAVLNVSEGSSVTNLTLVVLLLIPCVVLLLLLNCLLLGYKLLILSRRRRREDAMVRLQRLREMSDVSSLQDVRTSYMSLSEPVPPQPVTSSRASSRAPPQDHRIRLLRPDGATGSCSVRAPSTIRTASSFPAALGGSTPDLQPGSRTYRKRKNRCQSAPVLPRSSYSEAESRVDLVPPNSPTHFTGDVHPSSAYTFLTDSDRSAAKHVFDKVDQEYRYSEVPSQSSCFNMSAVGTGLDSDFGASAGVSLRILSADSDGLSNGILASALEWDYYDPCYVKQNHVQKQNYTRPAMHTKQYWV